MVAPSRPRSLPTGHDPTPATDDHSQPGRVPAIPGLALAMHSHWTDCPHARDRNHPDAKKTTPCPTRSSRRRNRNLPGYPACVGPAVPVPILVVVHPRRRWDVYPLTTSSSMGAPPILPSPAGGLANRAWASQPPLVSRPQAPPGGPEPSLASQSPFLVGPHVKVA
jgi:hypothetical protein